MRGISPLFLAGVVILVIVFAGFSGCTGTQIPGTPDPVAGTWNGYVARTDTSATVPRVVLDPEETGEMRLNIYDDGTFDYAAHYQLQQGTISSTGKGNYVVTTGTDDPIKKYIRYDSEKDSLTWESQGTSIEFRRNDKVWTHQDLVAYNDKLIAEITTPVPETTVLMVTPEPPREIASLVSEGIGYDPTTMTSWEFNGKLAVNYGVYQSVVVTLRYPDKDEYSLDLGGMGGANFTKRDVQVIMNPRVEKMVPRYFIRLDSTEYPMNVVLNVTRDGSGNVTGNFTDVNRYSAFATV